MMGVPTMVLTRVGFSRVVANAFAGFGFAPEAPTVHEFPLEMFLADSDLTPLENDLDKIVYGLTKWEPMVKHKGLCYAGGKVIIRGRDYRQAYANMNNLFLRKLWGDGLPIEPATEERVDEILTGTSLPRDTVIGKLLPRGGAASVEAIAVNLAMAGGRPEYLPVLIAIVRALMNPKSRHERWNATTNNCYPAVIVSGPIAKQIRLNSGYGCLGPSPEFPAGASIGRALRLLLMNVGGGIPGIGSMSIHGGPARYTNIVFAEDEDNLPLDWKPLRVERGFPVTSSTVTVLDVSSTNNIAGVGTSTEDLVVDTLDRCARYMQVPNRNNWNFTFTSGGTPGILLLAGSSAQGLSKLGWSKAKVQDYLWRHARLAEFPGIRKDLQAYKEEGISVPEQFPIPLAVSPDNITIVVAGGAQGGHGYWMQVGYGSDPVTVEIELAEKRRWDTLLDRADKDLGPLRGRDCASDFCAIDFGEPQRSTNA